MEAIKTRTCLQALERGNVHSVVSRLESMQPRVRVDVLRHKRSWWGNTILTDIIRLMNKERHKSGVNQNRFSRGANNPIRLILDLLHGDEDDEKSEILQLLLVADAYNRTPLHEACAYNDMETVCIILEAVANARQRGKLLSATEQDGSEGHTCTENSEWGYTPLYKAARWGSKEMVEYVVNCLPPERMITIMKLKSVMKETPLHASVWNREGDSVCLVFVKLLLLLHETHMKDVEEVLLALDVQGATFLHWAAEFRNLTAMKYLMGKAEMPMVTSLLKKLVKMKDKRGATILHYAAQNKVDNDVICELLEFLLAELKHPDCNDLIFVKDYNEQTFFHAAAHAGTHVMLKNILTMLPCETGHNLCDAKDKEGRLARDLAGHGLKADYIDQVGSYLMDIYPLVKPPKVLIFCCTKGRLAQSCDKEKMGAEEECNCVEKYFTQRNFDCTVKMDPTGDEIFSMMTEAQADEDLSALIVVVMSHGKKGLVNVEGNEDIAVQDIITHMYQTTVGKPKVLILQACQNNSTNLGDPFIGEDPPTSDDDRLDPVPASSSPTQEVTLRQPDFLLYQATVSGGYALRYLMIPCLVDCLRGLRPDTDLYEACVAANAMISTKLNKLDPNKRTAQQPKIESTLRKKLCLGKEFTSQPVQAVQLARVPSSPREVELETTEDPPSGPRQCMIM